MLFRSVLAAASGAVLSGALPPSQAWFLVIALVPLYVMVADAERPRHAFALGFWFALPFFVLYIWWLPASFAVPFGPLFWLVFPLLVLALSAIWGASTWLARLAGGRGPATLALLPALWVVVEWARSQGYLGFPWGVLGYAWIDTPVAQIADTIGVYGLSLLATASAACLALPLVGLDGRGRSGFGGRVRSRVRFVVPAAALLAVAGSWWVGELKLRQELPEPTTRAVLVQPDADPFARVTADQAERELSTLMSLTESSVRAFADPPGLVVWPEGAVLGVPVMGAAGASVRQRIQGAAPTSTIVLGTRVREGARATNTVFAMVDGQLVDRYDKRLLVPFGERWPFIEIAAPLYRAVFGLFGLPMMVSTHAGDAFDPLATPLGSLAVYVCYESVFPQATAAMVGAGAQVLVNVTNDAWFARGAGARQHFDMGRMRAIEADRYLLRSGNDGITAAVDPAGRTTAELERGVADALTVRYELRDTRTPYVRFGWLLVPLVAAYAAAVAAASALRR